MFLQDAGGDKPKTKCGIEKNEMHQTWQVCLFSVLLPVFINYTQSYMINGTCPALHFVVPLLSVLLYIPQEKTKR